jgi:hypothetical protein
VVVYLESITYGLNRGNSLLQFQNRGGNEWLHRRFKKTKKAGLTEAVDEFSGITKPQRDDWIRAFWRCLDEHPDVGRRQSKTWLASRHSAS